jgi:hypothetical protein
MGYDATEPGWNLSKFREKILPPSSVSKCKSSKQPGRSKQQIEQRHVENLFQIQVWKGTQKEVIGVSRRIRKE